MKIFNSLINGKYKIVVLIVGVLGIALIFFSSFPKAEPAASQGVEQYRQELQNSLASILSQIEGVGDVSVLLTIENSAEGVYLENNSTKTKDIEPVVRGVVVACEGAGEPEVKERVYEAVTKALSLSSAKVCVTQLNTKR
ncbi:MAG: hypothetical protein IIU14_09165 [Ruminococcus sp.]|nr:hypothetical protein [Ruminococcus sp.]